MQSSESARQHPRWDYNQENTTLFVPNPFEMQETPAVFCAFKLTAPFPSWETGTFGVWGKESHTPGGHSSCNSDGLCHLCQFIPESARFNVSTGNTQAALATLERIAKMNRSVLPEGKLVEPILVSSWPGGPPTKGREEREGDLAL